MSCTPSQRLRLDKLSLVGTFEICRILTLDDVDPKAAENRLWRDISAFTKTARKQVFRYLSGR